ncbi:cellulose binding domain-containing protein, partial [Streptomyces sp. SID3343]|uniref:cellulose binding domain-containing protein n=1 Tax=Streptomyces sp. SID3343 TaxID=2690260 RepID=UPI0013C219FA
MGSHGAGGPEPGTARPRWERIRRPLASVALAALPAALIVALSGGTSSHHSALSADYVRTGSWPTGYSGQYVLRNDGAHTVEGWTLRFDLPQGTRVANAWNGRLDRAGTKYTLRNENWNKALRPGESIVVGFEVRREDPVGAPATEPAHPDSPLACTINDKPCQDPARPTATRSPRASEPAPATGSVGVPGSTRAPERRSPTPSAPPTASSSPTRVDAPPTSGAPTTPAPG